MRPRIRTEPLWYTRCPVPTALAVALDTGMLQGEFAPDGLELRSLASSPLASVRDAHYDHRHPRLFRHGGNMPPLMARSRGADVRVVGLSWTDLSLPILAQPDSGIHEPGDLTGKRLPLPRRRNVGLDCWEPAVLRGYERALATVGLGLDAIELVEIEVDRTFSTRVFASADSSAALWDPGFVLSLQREEISALLRGEVDAMFSESGIAATVTEMFGLRTVVDLADLPGPDRRVTLPLPLTVTVSGRLLDDEPQLVSRWLAQMIRAAEWASENRRSAMELLAAEIAVPAGSVEKALGPEANRQLGIDLRPEHVAALQDQADFLFENGYLESGPLDVETFTDSRPLTVARALTTEPAPTVELETIKES